ncbi:outer membrane beta-barrel protein [Taibaiella helva]|uniref:outer membrane beta-barrel protein n=1 Tax=Taibaiella helva TaxID=2301235 RepID=UPI000E59906A|nr:outer membrane beta-barrel protein [Taibaiella helva]
MKRISLLLLAVLGLSGINQVSAQLQKGNIMVGANLADLGIKLQSGTTGISFSINPKVGWFIQDNIAIGGEVGLGLDHQSVSSISTNAINYKIGGFGRYYISDPRAILLKHSRFFVEANAGFTGTNTKTEGAPSVTTNGLGLGVGPGVAYFITPNVGLEALLKYDLGLGFGSSVTSHNFSIAVGFQIYLPTKKARALYEEASGEVREKMKKSKKNSSEDDE